jgi:hypothetical protein
MTTKTNTKPTPKLTKSVQDGYDACETTSARIRYLASQGMDRGDIARVTGKRYQHVRNVLITPLKKAG